ncbi:MAG: hypothetical protein KDK70_19620 [Myxococcales bacterium]|nr:hypothetical protein [Myxococcales bacterium]
MQHVLVVEHPSFGQGDLIRCELCNRRGSLRGLEHLVQRSRGDLDECSIRTGLDLPEHIGILGDQEEPLITGSSDDGQAPRRRQRQLAELGAGDLAPSIALGLSVGRAVIAPLVPLRVDRAVAAARGEGSAVGHAAAVLAVVDAVVAGFVATDDAVAASSLGSVRWA